MAVGLGAGVSAVQSTMTAATSSATSSASEAAAATDAAEPGGTYSLEDDPRVRAFIQAYAPLIDSVAYGEEDVVFSMGGDEIHFRDGRMLAADRLGREDECDSIFYEYPLGPLTEPPDAPEEMPRYCPDLLESLWGDSESEVRAHGRSVRFLDHRMFVNGLLVEPLARVEREIRSVASTEPAVAEWVDEMEITYSFSYRRIAGSSNRSQHSWGTAVDFVPSSYGGRAVYWRWSRVLTGEGWDRIPVEGRWSPPRTVVEIFERNGFVWGGKWAYFDMIHFEYRPEILLYNRLLGR